jgi:mono/diheme cytochrome c family protein
MATRHWLPDGRLGMMDRAIRRGPGLAVLIILTSVATGCGAASDSDNLSPAATEGHEIARSNGCAACHGSSGQGGVGPAFVGLYGAEVALDDGTTAVADANFLSESIRNPAATKVAGYKVEMPDNDLSDAEIESVIAYIRELAESATP